MTSSNRCQGKAWSLSLSSYLSSLWLQSHSLTHSSDALDILYSDLLMLWWRITLWLLSCKYLLHFQFHSDNLLSRNFALYIQVTLLHFVRFASNYSIDFRNIEFLFSGAQKLASECFVSQDQSFFWNWDILTQWADSSHLPSRSFPLYFSYWPSSKLRRSQKLSSSNGESFHVNSALKTHAALLTGFWLILAKTWVHGPPPLNLLPDFTVKYQISKAIP